MEDVSQKSRGAHWYSRYPQLRSEVQRLRRLYLDRCAALGVEPDVAMKELQNSIVARAVHESNWQEGHYLNPHRTRELLDIAFNHLPSVQGPHVDLKNLVAEHRKEVLELKAQNISDDELATYNLSKAHFALKMIATEMNLRWQAGALEAIRIKQRELQKSALMLKEQNPNEDEWKRSEEIAQDLEAFLKGLDLDVSQTGEVDLPFSLESETMTLTLSELYEALKSVDFAVLVRPMHMSYVHSLHTLTMMGMLSASKVGQFRQHGVHVGDFDVMFPEASSVPGLMDEFCKKFPGLIDEDDAVLEAARLSHAFVRIHPYADGNGRVSRLLMNLVLTPTHPPAYLKADKKGRSRYIQALRRANRGNLEPLACLISMSLIATYKQALEAVGIRDMEETTEETS